MILEGKSICHLHRMPSKVSNTNLRWTAWVTFLSLIIGQTLPKTGFPGVILKDDMLPFLLRYLTVNIRSLEDSAVNQQSKRLDWLRPRSAVGQAMLGECSVGRTGFLLAAMAFGNWNLGFFKFSPSQPFLKCVALWPVVWVAHNSVARSAHSRERYCRICKTLRSVGEIRSSRESCTIYVSLHHLHSTKQRENPVRAKCGHSFADCRPHKDLNPFYRNHKMLHLDSLKMVNKVKLAFLPRLWRIWWRSILCFQLYFRELYHCFCWRQHHS
jgi:hypothetical protein